MTLRVTVKHVAVYPLPDGGRRIGIRRFTPPPCRMGNAGRFTPVREGGTPNWNEAVYTMPDGGTPIWFGKDRIN